MNLNLKDQLFIVGGATSGLGKAIALGLISEGAKVIAIARNEEKVHAFVQEYPTQLEGIVGDITKEKTISKIVEQVGDRYLHGAVINAGGPPAMSFMKTTIEDWDAAFQSVMRWKIILTKQLLPKMQEQAYGRFVFVESTSIKQPLANLVLSTSFRLGVVGFVKTLSQEIADSGITLNILAPGPHATPRLEQIIQRKAERTGISFEAARDAYYKRVKVGKVGDPNEFASLALWFLSPVSRYITGQTITVDGGVVVGTF